MKSVFGLLFIICLLHSNVSLAGIIDDREQHTHAIDKQISEHFNPFELNFYEMGMASLPGVTIVSDFAGSTYFFGTGAVWNNTAQANNAPDGISSEARIFPTDSSRYLFVKNFGFNIPCNATITNLTLKVTRQNKTTTGVSCEDSQIAVFNPYTLQVGSVNMKDPNPWVEGGVTWETINYSHANWGVSVTPEMINDPRFGFVIEARAIDNAGIAFANVDAVELEVCYTVSGPPLTPIVFITEKVDACYDMGSITINAGGGSGNYLYSINNGVSFQASNVFNNLPLGEYIIIVKNSDDTCETDNFYCNLSGDDRVLQPGDAMVACATFPGNRVTLAVEKIQPFHDYYLAGETGYDVSSYLPNHPHEWKIEDFGGEVYSFDIDEMRNIYTGVTMLYDLVPGVAIPPIVAKIDAFTGVVTVLNTLPGNVGVNTVEYDTICDQLYVANMGDGKIYRMDPNTGSILSSFDPLTLDNGAPGMAPLGERILGMGYNHVDNRLYYAMWNSDFNKTGIRNTIRSVGFNPITCDFDAASDQLELNLPWTSEYGDPGNLQNYSMPVGDIEFSDDGATMLLAETGFDSSGPQAKPHESRVLRYIGSSGAWILQTTVPPGNINLQHELGEVSQGLNARGGVDFANSGFNTITNCSIDDDQYIIATADALRGADCNTLGCLYGLQYLPITGGNSQNSVLLDIARDLGSQQKSVFGDVDVIKGCVTPFFCCPELSSPTPDMAECQGATLPTISAISQGDSVAIVYFNSIPSDSAAIYTLGTKLDSAAIVGGNATLNLNGFPNNTPGTYYVYLVDHPTSFLDYCRPYDSIIVTIFADPTPGINTPADQCIDGADMNFTGSPLPGGGTTGVFTTNASGGLTDNGNGTAVLDISVAGPGTWDVYYTYTDINNCFATASSSVTIFDFPTVTIDDPADECVDGPDFNFIGTPAPGGGNTGVFSTTAPGGLTDNGDGTATLDPALAGVGTYDVTYSYTTTTGCFGSASSSVTVDPLPVAGLNDPADECVDNGPMLFTGSPTPGGSTAGSFSTTAPGGLTDNGDGTASLDVFAAGPGTYDVTYLYTDANGCQDTETVSVLIYDRLPDVVIDPGQVCGDPLFGATSIDLTTLITSGPTNGTWADTDGTGGLSGSVFTADISMEGNTYTFSYTITGPGPNGTTCQTRSFTTTVSVVYCSLDLALINTTSQTLPVQLNDLVTFDITVCNQGFTIVDSIEITNYLGSCYGFSANNGWVASGSDAVITLTTGNGRLPAGGLLPPSQSANNCVTVSIDVTIDCRFPAQLINYAEITASSDTGGNTGDIDSSPGSDNLLERNVLPGSPDDDSFFDTNEDDHDPATMPVIDVAMIMNTVTSGPYSYTQPVLYDIEVRNQGNIDLANVVVSDYIPCGMTYSPSNNPLWSLAGSIATTTIPSLDVGEIVNIPITLIVTERAVSCTDIDAWLNEAEVSSMTDDSSFDVSLLDIDSNSDQIQLNDAGGVPNSGSDNVFNGDGSGTPVSTDPATDEDDSDPARISVYDLQLTKIVTSSGPYGQDSVVTYSIAITNDGSQDASNVQITDNPQAGLVYTGSDALGNANVNEIFPQNWIIASLPAMAVEVINVSYTVDSNFQGLNLINRVEITADDGDDIDSDPDTDDTIDEDGDGNGDDDDEDSQTVTIDQYYDLALTKTEFSTGPYYPGSQITYEISVINEGTFNANNIVILDSPDADLSFISDNSGSNPNVTNVGPGQYSIGLLMNGTTETFLVTYEVDGFYQLPDITNRAQIIVDDGADVDSDPNTDDTVDEDGDSNGDDDDEDLVTLTILQSYDLELTKAEISSPPYLPGDYITYELTITNDGTLDAANVQISDTPSPELTYFSDNAGSNPNVNNLGGLIYEIINLPARTTERIQITFQVDPAYMGYIVSNDTEIILDDGDDIDSDPDTSNDIDEDGDSDPFDDDEDRVFTDITQIYDLRIEKTIVGQNGVLPGDNVTFLVQIYNEGTLDANNIEITERPDSELFYIGNTSGGNANITEISPTQYTIISLPSGAQESFEITYQLDPGTLELTTMNVIQITVDDGDDQDSDPDTDETVDEDFDGDGYDDDEASAVVSILGSGEIGDYIWHDLDGDGIQDFNEPPFAGVEVRLYNNEGFFMDVTNTDNSGYYLFTEVFPGDYYIEIDFPEGYTATLPYRGSNTSVDSDMDESNGPATTGLFTILPGDLRYDIDMGLIKCALLGDYVWFDYNENDRKDVFENGINQLKVELYRFEVGTWVLWDETYTGPVPDKPSGDGYYKFCVIPGTYYIKFVNPPETLVPAVPNIGPEDKDSDITGVFGPGTTNSYTVISGQEICDIGAGFYEMGTIGDHVWFDSNENGMQDNGESGIEGVLVKAIDLNGNLMNVATTDASGNYTIDYLPKQTYYIQFDAPAGLSLTSPHEGTDESIDSDVDNSNGPYTTKLYNVQPGEHLPHIDAGFIAQVLPVVWSDIWGEHRTKHNYIQWTVASEQNVSHYELLRSIGDRNSFELIAKKFSVGNSNTEQIFQYEDFNLQGDGIYYYKVKQLDLDGRFSYSKTIAVQVSDSEDILEHTFNMYPNPVINELTLETKLISDSERLSVDIIDGIGRLVAKDILVAEQLGAGHHVHLIKVTDLPEGVYTVKVNIDRYVMMKKLIVIDN